MNQNAVGRGAVLSLFRYAVLSLSLGAGALMPVPGSAADVVTYVLGKNHHFDQLPGTAPAENTLGEAWEAGINVYQTALASVTAASLSTLGTTQALVNVGSRFELSQYYPLKTGADAAMPNGNYFVTISTAHDGVKTCSLSLTNDAYPNAPFITNTNEVQSINASLSFTLHWAPFSGATTNDYVLLVASQSYDDSGPVYFSTPLPNQAGTLFGTNLQDVIPANTLPANVQGYLKVGFFKMVNRNTNGYPGVPGFAGYGAITKIAFQTISFPVVTTPLPATIITNAGATVNLSVQATGGALIYQWWRDGTRLTGATNNLLTLTSVRSTNSGAYSLVISNAVGTITNGPTYLVVVTGAPGSLDTDFSTGVGPNNAVRALALRPDGTILVGGSFTNFNSTLHPRIVSLTPTGGVDASFAPANGADNDVHCLALQPDGKLLVGGSFNFIGGLQRPGLTRLLPNGSVDATFTTGTGIAGGSVFAVAWRADGKIAIGGNFSSVNGTARTRVALLNTNGTLDTTFVATCNGDVRALAFLPDNRLLVGGAFTQVNSSNRPVVAQLLATGGLDPSFTAPPVIDYNAYAVVLQPDGKIVLGGGFDRVGSLNVGHLLRLNPTGTLDATFKPGIGAGYNVRTVALQPDNKILIGGEFTDFDNLRQTRVARLNPDGSLDQTFNTGTGANNIVMSMAPQPDGKILVGGFFTLFNATASNYLARINGGGSTPAPSFTYQPISQTVFAGEEAGFYVSAACSQLVNYQWRRNGNDIPNETNASLILHAVQPVSQALYSVMVSNAAGNIFSSNASLTVLPQPQLLEHLAHRYSFGEASGSTQVNDSVGGAHGILLSLGAGEGFTGSGMLNLAGVNAYAALPPHLISVLTNTTIEAWVTWNGPATSQYQTVFDFFGGSGAFHLTPYSDFPTARVFFSTNIFVIARPVLRDLPPAVGTPIHYAVVYHFDAGTSKLYVNGQLAAVGSAPSPLSALTDLNCWLGRANGPPNFNGSYDEFRIYDAALSDAAILNSYVAGPDVEQLSFTVSGGNLILSWPILGVPTVLETTTSLTLSFQGFAYTATTNIVTGRIEVSLPNNSPRQFYRLRRL